MMAIVSRPHVRVLFTVLAVAASLEALVPLRMAMATPPLEEAVPLLEGFQSSLKKYLHDAKDLIDPAKTGFEIFNDHADHLQFSMPRPGGNSPPYAAAADVNAGNPKFFVARIDINSPVTLTGPCQGRARTVPCSGLACRHLYGGEQPPNCDAVAPCRYPYGGGEPADVLHQGPVALSAGSSTILPSNIVYACRLSPGAAAVLGLGRSSTLARRFRTFSYNIPVSDGHDNTVWLYAGLAVAQQGGGTPTPLIANPVYPDRYYVQITNILVGSQALQIPPGALALQPAGTGGVYLSSTVPIGMLLNREVYQLLVAAFLQHFPAPRKPSEFDTQQLCYDMATQPLPMITLVFTNNAVMELPSGGSVWRTQRDGARCLAILPSPWNTGETVLGIMAQMGRRMTYQLAADGIHGTVAF